MEEAAAELGRGTRNVGSAHRASGEREQKGRVGQAQEARRDPHCRVLGRSGAGRRVRREDTGPKAKPKSMGLFSARELRGQAVGFPRAPSPVPGAHHADDVWVDRLNEDPPGAPHALHQLIECRPLHLLPLQVSHTVQEVKHHPTLGQLPAQQLMQLRGWHIWGRRRGLSPGRSCCSSGQGWAFLIPRAGSSAPMPRASGPSPTPCRK